MLNQLLAGLKGQTSDFVIVESFRQARIFLRSIPHDFVRLTIDVALILHTNFDLLLDLSEQDRIIGE